MGWVRLTVQRTAAEAGLLLTTATAIRGDKFHEVIVPAFAAHTA
jgi:hypothetical protein